jgi:ribosomal protein S16
MSNRGPAASADGIGQEVAEPLLTHRLERGAAVRERVAELLTQTGIAARHARHPPGP